MTINKYTGKTEEEAMSKVRKELGNAAVIMNVKVIKPKGLGGLFKSSTYEVTAAVEDDDVRNNPFVPEDVATAVSNSQDKNAASISTSVGFDAVADDAIKLKDAFSAVNEVLEKQEDKSSMPKQDFEPLSDIPSFNETIDDVKDERFTYLELMQKDKLQEERKSLKSVIQDLEDEVLANA